MPAPMPHRRRKSCAKGSARSATTCSPSSIMKPWTQPTTSPSGNCARPSSAASSPAATRPSAAPEPGRSSPRWPPPAAKPAPPSPTSWSRGSLSAQYSFNGAKQVPAPNGLVGEHRTTGERKYHLANHPADTPLEVLAALVKARWVCEQAHQQLKEELGLDHFEGRSWRGLHHHALLCQLAFAFLQHLRLRGKKRSHPVRARTAAKPEPARDPAADRGGAHPRAPALPALPATLRASSPAMN